ncbi:MAG: SDR family oxidoreductase [Maricaulaceae bacterium]|jgi:NAD(P)-dependent dehydrogenase (short-subunit alcohol dehydrogenase family)
MSAPEPAVLVTGAGARVGKAIALTLGRAGWAVAVHYNRSKGPAEETAQAIRDAGGRAAAVQGDLSDPDALAAIIPAAAEALDGPLTALVNNASTFEDDRLTSMTAESWDHHLAANLRAPCFLAQGFAAQLPAEAEGAIVNILDQRVKKPTPQFFTYSLSKAGLAWATVTMAQELAPRTRVNAVLPGPTLKNPRQSDADWEKQTKATILGRGSPPEDIADAVRYLLDASAVTGQLLAVDGGQHLVWQTPDVWGVSE